METMQLIGRRGVMERGWTMNEEESRGREELRGPKPYVKLLKSEELE